MQTRNIYLSIIAILISTAVLGQSSLGVFAGLNNSKLKGDVPVKAKYKSLMGMNLGLHYDLKINKTIALSLQAAYSQEGTRVFYKVSGKDEPVDSIRIGLNYISIPLLLKITSTSEKFYAIGGIETGILMDSYMRIDEKDENLKESVAQLNLAMHFGAGYRIPIGIGRLFIELRYSQGLVNLTDEPINTNVIPRVKTNGIKILAGYEIPLSKQKK